MATSWQDDEAGPTGHGRARRAADGADAPTRGGSLLSVVDAAARQQDAVLRHRLARSRREARPGPLLSALATLEDAPPADSVAGDKVTDEPRQTASAAPRERSPVRQPRTDSASMATEDATDMSVAKAILDAARRYRKPKASAQPDEPVTVLAVADTGGGDHWKPLIDPMKVINGILHSKLLILSTTVLGAALGVMIALSTPKHYESATELLVDPRDIKVSDRELIQGGLPSDATLAIVENQVRVITSGTVLNAVVDKLRLADDPEFNGSQEGGIGLGSFMSMLRSLLARQDSGDADSGRAHALAVEHLGKVLSVERSGKTFVVVIRAKTENPDKSALIANTTTDVFLAAYGKLQSETAGRAADELAGGLEEQRAALEEAERKVEQFKAENDLIDAQGRLITDDEILKLNDQLSNARARTLELNARAQSLRGIGVDDVLTGSVPEEAASNVMTELRAQYAALRQEADRMSVRLGPRHPERLAVDAQLTGARDRIGTELRRISSAAQVDLKRAVQLEQELASRLAQLKVRQGSVSNELVSLRELERDVTAKRAVYESFLLRARETGEQRGINTANMTVISQAYPPLEPTGPSRAMIAAGGTALGFLFGIGIGGSLGAYQSLRESGLGRRNKRAARLVDTPDDPEPFAEDDPLPPEPPAPAPSDPDTTIRSASDTPKEAPEMDYRYPQQSPAFAHQQPSEAWPAGQHPGYPQHAAHPGHVYAAPPAGQVPYYAAQPAPQGWYPQAGAPMPPQPAYAYPQPAPYYPQQPAHPYPPHQAAPVPYYPAADRGAANPDMVAQFQSPIEEIRASLREFRDAVRDLTESRTKRRFF